MAVTLTALRRDLRGVGWQYGLQLCAGPDQQMEDSIMSLQLLLTRRCAVTIPEPKAGDGDGDGDED